MLEGTEMLHCGMEKAPSRADLRRSHLLETARQLFAERGFHQTGMAQIAAASGIKVGQIYRDFESNVHELFFTTRMTRRDYLLGRFAGSYFVTSLIFLGIGAMTDFGPLIARPSALFMGAGAQLGISIAFLIALLLGFDPKEASSIGIIGGADGPTAIYLTTKLAPHLLPAIAVAAYSYMALIPMIQPPIMRLLTTKKEREVVMSQTRAVTYRNFA